jgi:hypothetical protein
MFPCEKLAIIKAKINTMNTVNAMNTMNTVNATKWEDYPLLANILMSYSNCTDSQVLESLRGRAGIECEKLNMPFPQTRHVAIVQIHIATCPFKELIYMATKSGIPTWPIGSCANGLRRRISDWFEELLANERINDEDVDSQYSDKDTSSREEETDDEADDDDEADEGDEGDEDDGDDGDEKDMKDMKDMMDMKDMEDTKDMMDMKDMKDMKDMEDMKDTNDVNDAKEAKDAESRYEVYKVEEEKGKVPEWSWSIPTIEEYLAKHNATHKKMSKKQLYRLAVIVSQDLRNSS